jgi:phospholipase D1/2
MLVRIRFNLNFIISFYVLFLTPFVFCRSGGIDLTYGRYDDGTYPLFRTLQTDHKYDFKSSCAPDVNRTAGPRQPWHDIHSRVEGLGALDVLQNFEERWIGQGGLPEALVKLGEKGIKGYDADYMGIDDGDDEDTNTQDDWTTQVFRSIDERTAKLKSPHVKAIAFDEIKGVEFGKGKKIQGNRRQSIWEHVLSVGREQEQRFVASSSPQDGTMLEVARPLDFKRDLRVDTSCHKALVHHIRNANHAVYMESQYFLSSSHLWPEKKTGKCCNLVAAELTFKICEKIEAGLRFAAYVLLPMWPDGLPVATAVQTILAFQCSTMKTMYKRIAQSIARRRKTLASDGTQQQISEYADIKPTDYLNFYCLVNREAAQQGTEKQSGGNGLLNRTRRHLVYTHSKMTIVDDAVICIGTANINQRSLDGIRDSEIMLGAFQPAHLATQDSVARGEVHGFRLHCFAHLTGTMDDTFVDPSSLECVRRFNAIANDNWNQYTQDEVCDMTSYVVPYPVKILEDGDVHPVTDSGKFPDTNAPILGTRGNLPEFLTT